MSTKVKPYLTIESCKHGAHTCFFENEALSRQQEIPHEQNFFAPKTQNGNTSLDKS